MARRTVTFVLLSLMALAVHAGAQPGTAPRNDLPQPHRTTRDWGQLPQWRQFGRPSGIYITRDDTIYVADSELGPDTGARELMGIRKGIRIGSATDGRLTAFIEDMEPTTPDHSGAAGVGVDAQGNVYGAVVRRQMLERHVKK